MSRLTWLSVISSRSPYVSWVMDLSGTTDPLVGEEISRNLLDSPPVWYSGVCGGHLRYVRTTAIYFSWTITVHKECCSRSQTYNITTSINRQGQHLRQCVHPVGRETSTSLTPQCLVTLMLTYATQTYRSFPYQPIRTLEHAPPEPSGTNWPNFQYDVSQFIQSSPTCQMIDARNKTIRGSRFIHSTLRP